LTFYGTNVAISFIAILSGRIANCLVSKEVNLQLEQINFYYDIAWHLMNVLSLLKMLNQRMTKSTYL